MAVSKLNPVTSATQKIAQFNASGTWTCPTGVTTAEFLVVGAGGAGGGAGANSATTDRAVGGGGGGGAVKRTTLSVTPGTSYTITVGAKGTGATGAAGGNGGFSEVLNGATTLIRAYGGRGGAGINSAGAAQTSVAAITATGGGQAAGDRSADNQTGGGGGGAGNIFWSSDGTTLQQLQVYQLGVDGGLGYRSSEDGAFFQYRATGGIGIDNFGGGGGGGVYSSGNAPLPTGQAPYGAGAGAVRTNAGSTAGTAALANTGSGGGGGCVVDTITTVAGGNGSDGYVSVVYFG